MMGMVWGDNLKYILASVLQMFYPFCEMQKHYIQSQMYN